MAADQPKRYIEIIRAVSEMIQNDGLKSGDKLPSERELSDRLDVGRSSIREALRGLELLDLIETRRGEGTFMKATSSYKLVDLLLSFVLKDEQARKDLTETRRIIELEALKLACERITDEQIRKLDTLILRSKKEWNQGDFPVEEDYRFHKTIVKSCQNVLLFHIWKSLVAFNKEAIKESLERSGRPPISIKEHEQIVEALKKRDSEQALKAMRLHLQNSRF
ncbi:FadR/GntR family transcriptional regulator [Shouchella clausii]|jgi:GntR family transcriptional regulator, transcriptional repressor for pyruvate dehydrogenase complex|uniref:Transcriptional regulator n=1 Tax=Shouchella clausii TaxID=79880 RepID=A0A268S2Q0_SHOCL|nr:FadR/GntR family transcriptional regulator [Shouchella clausii]PAD42554.1 transcriptional regulator [Bacillus sp. 7520-S]SPU21925.1 transcriptional regulator [Niallia circulans]AST97005.1 transcriptional regulator [Shouchella clausii]MBU8594544.1 FadR family transcriptional regulator [Shouchella clausii]MCM3547496.1 FadR family transcriptional regulator [Shouchella clausii]